MNLFAMYFPFIIVLLLAGWFSVGLVIGLYSKGHYVKVQNKKGEQKNNDHWKDYFSGK